MKYPKVYNQIYDDLKEKWYEADDDPVAVLRAENKLKNPWVLKEIAKNFDPKETKILDVGCGGGFLSNFLAPEIKEVHAIDISGESIKVAKKYDTTGKVKYLTGDASELPYEDNSFDVVCLMDMLEHVENPAEVIKEGGRVLKPGGQLFFHTFNRTPMSWFLAIKFLEWFVPGTPKNMHVYHLFIKPKELQKMGEDIGLSDFFFTGTKAVMFSMSTLKSLISRKLHPDFKFKFTKSLGVGYVGYARKL